MALLSSHFTFFRFLMARFLNKTEEGRCLDCNVIIHVYRRTFPFFLHLCSSCLQQREETLENIMGKPPVDEAVGEVLSQLVTIVSGDDGLQHLRDDNSSPSSSLSSSPPPPLESPPPSPPLVKRGRGRPPGRNNPPPPLVNQPKTPKVRKLLGKHLFNSIKTSVMPLV